VIALQKNIVDSDCACV